MPRASHTVTKGCLLQTWPPITKGTTTSQNKCLNHRSLYVPTEAFKQRETNQTIETVSVSKLVYMQAYTDCTNVSLHTHTLACKEHLGDEDLVGNYDSRRLGKQRRSARHVKAVLEQLCNHITHCLNRPLRDALSFPAGKADQSQLSSPWSRGEIEMWVDWSGTEGKVR